MGHIHHGQVLSNGFSQLCLRRCGSPLPALGKDATPSLPLGHLSDHTGLSSHLRLAFAALFIVDRTGHGQTPDIKAAQCGDTCTEREEAGLEGLLMEDGMLQEEPTLEGGAKAGVEV